MSEQKPHSKRIIGNQEGYDQWSEFYDVYPNPTVAMDEIHFPASWGHLTAKKILEIGCGTGRHTQKLTRQGNFVIAIDLSEGMLAKAREKIKSPHVHFVHGDFLTLNDLGYDFDVVIESLVLEHLPDLSTFFKKAAQALKTGGELYLSEIHPVRAQEGILAHFKTPESDEIYLTSHPHQEIDFLRAGQDSGLRLLKNLDILGDESLAKIKASWSRHQGRPMVRIMHFVKE